ncbi:hypothetical protein [Streptomyces sp. AC555_RSS877]|uniref:hypothetical protein n=1 Tax=Streptomyces sp. AC555_RSS877 TaxID=2823688 RepID=UPI001C275D89|nr:hypothetical protein [Streptomyces sp. AC555_RSS877]
MRRRGRRRPHPAPQRRAHGQQPRYSAEGHCEVLHAYTLAAYDDMNRHLRFGAFPADVTREDVRRQVSVLSDLIDAQEPTTSEKTLYRGCATTSWT